jgi:hypothetical protein
MRRYRRPDGMPRHWLSCYVGDVLLLIPAIILFCLMMLFEKAYSGLRRTAVLLSRRTVGRIEITSEVVSVGTAPTGAALDKYQ